VGPEIGTINIQTGTWLWAWDNPSIAEPLRQHAPRNAAALLLSRHHFGLPLENLEKSAVDAVCPQPTLCAMSAARFTSASEKLRLPLLPLLLLAPATASAHTETGLIGGFLSGFTHPLTGLDHMVAMLAVGLWGAFLGQRAMWTLPVVFPVVMALGGAAGVLGAPLPAVETGIALSAVVLGAMVALGAKPPLWLAGIIVGLFAIFHGHAHGTELPQSANALVYAIGFVIATGLLHLAGIALGLMERWPWGKIALRAGGGVIAGVGFAFLFGLL
jgi:urease accessory protein